MIMDVEFSSLTIFLSLFIFVFMLLKLTSISKTRSESTLNLPPGPRKLPLIGNLHLFASSRPSHQTLRDLAIKYGPMMHLKLGEVNTVVISSPEVAEEVLKTHDINFAYRPSFLVSEIMCYNKSDISSAPYGEHWRERRKICTLELLSAKRVQSFQPIREGEFSNLCRWLASNAGSPVNLTEKVTSTTCGVVAEAVIGKKTKELDTFFLSMLAEISALASGFHIGDLYPSIKLFRLVGGFKGRLEVVRHNFDKILGNIIDEHKVANAANNANKAERREDLVDVLLKFHDNRHELSLTTDNIKALVLNMFLAGVETSTTTTNWAMAEMLRHPRILKKAQDEVRQVFDRQGYVDESYSHELKYLKLFIKETLRMHPPVPLLLPRESSEQCKINGYDIPRKARVLVNAWANGRDPRHWKEPESFEPERFLDNSVDHLGYNFEYIPFGAGRRICPGMSYGLANVELPLAMFLYHFDWILPDGLKPEELDMTETFGITASRKSHLHVIPIVKRPLPA